MTDLFLLDIVIIYSTDSVIFYSWRNTPTYLPSLNSETTNETFQQSGKQSGSNAANRGFSVDQQLQGRVLGLGVIQQAC